MSVPAPSASLLWSHPGGLRSGDCPTDRSVRVQPSPVDEVELISDADLLRAFVEAPVGTVAAAAVLSRIVERHGALVYQVAQRMMVNDRSLADDVFQATFLVLAQSARKIQRSASLASWLHGTARNIGRRALAQKYAVRSGNDSGVEMVTAVEDDPFSEMIRSHERQLLDEELQKLPDQHRAPLVLHYLEERSHQEISQLLGITVAAVESRLKRAKQELRVRLVRRGITLSLAVAAFNAATSVASAAPPAALVTSTISLAATGTVVSTSLTAATASTAIQLAGKELAAMSAGSQATALFVGAAGTLTVGGAVLFGAGFGGFGETRSGAGPVSGDPFAVTGTDTGLGGFEEEPRTWLLAMADEAPDEGDKPEEASEEPDDDQPDAPAEKDDDAPASNEESESSEEMEQPSEDQPDEAPDEGDKPEEAPEEPDHDQPDDDQPDDDQPETPAEKDDDAPASNEESESSEEMEHASEDQPDEEGDENAEHPSPIVASFRHLSAAVFPRRVNGEHLSVIVASFRHLSAADRKVYEALDQNTSLEFPDNTLQEIVDFLQQKHQLRIRLDEQALTDAGLDTESRVNLVINEVPLSTSLTLLLENVNGTKLGYYVDRGILFITTSDRMEGEDKLRFYDLSGDIENLAQAVEAYAMKSLEGDQGYLQITSLGDCLAIETTYAKHQKIEEFITGALQLTAAREVVGKEPPVVPPLPLKAPVPRRMTRPAGG